MKCRLHELKWCSWNTVHIEFSALGVLTFGPQWIAPIMTIAMDNTDVFKLWCRRNEIFSLRDGLRSRWRNSLESYPEVGTSVRWGQAGFVSTEVGVPFPFFSFFQDSSLLCSEVGKSSFCATDLCLKFLKL